MGRCKLDCPDGETECCIAVKNKAVETTGVT